MALHRRLTGALGGRARSACAVKGGPRYGIDFKGGTLMTVKFAGKPPIDEIRAAVSNRVTGESDGAAVRVTIRRSGDRHGTGGRAADDQNRRAVQDTLRSNFGHPQSGKLDFNNAGRDVLADRLRMPLARSSVAISDAAAAETGSRYLQFPRHAAALGVDHQFRSTFGGAGRKLCYYQHSQTAMLSGAVLDSQVQKCRAEGGRRAADNGRFWPPFTRWVECWYI